MNREQGIIAGMIAITTVAIAAFVAILFNGGNDATQNGLTVIGFAAPTVAGLFAGLKSDQAANSATDAANTATDTSSALVKHTAAVAEQIAAVTDATAQAIADKTEATPPTNGSSS